YENTLGRLFEWVRGSEPTAEDLFAAADAQLYAAFLHQTPWYQYPFAARLGAFWRETPFRGPSYLRSLERRFAFSLEYGLKSPYGAVIGYASAATLGLADLEIKTIVQGLDVSDVADIAQIRVIRQIGPDRTLILTPRYQAYTEILVALAHKGRDIV